MALREIILDTETTGLQGDDRIIEIGAIEVIDGVETEKHFHQRIKPNKPIAPDASAVHGIYDHDLEGCPEFHEVVDSFLEFIGDDDLVIHNAPFDMGKLNYEMSLLSRAPIKNKTIDTLMLARKRWPGARNNLDAVADRLGIDRSFRTLHGALIDCVLLSMVYNTMIGRDDLLKASEEKEEVVEEIVEDDTFGFMPPEARHHWFESRPPVAISPEEDANHRNFVEKIKDSLWGRLFGEKQV